MEVVSQAKPATFTVLQAGCASPPHGEMRERMFGAWFWLSSKAKASLLLT